MTILLRPFETNDSVVSAMSSHLGRLRSALLSAQTIVGGSTVIGIGGWEFLGSSSSKEASLGALSMYSGLIDRLDADRSKVLSGEWTYSKWENQANLVWNNIQGEAKEIGNWSAISVVTHSAEASVSDAKKVATVTGIAALPILILIGLGLVAYILLMTGGARGVA